jgi:hypothetical protein
MKTKNIFSKTIMIALVAALLVSCNQAAKNNDQNEKKAMK